MDESIDRGDAYEKALAARMARVYNNALRESVASLKDFWAKMELVRKGKITPPPWYDEAQKKKWLEGFAKQEARLSDNVKMIAERMNEAGVQCAADIQDFVANVYADNYGYVRKIALDGRAKVTVRSSFSIFDERELEVLKQTLQTPFSKIAYKRMGDNPEIVSALSDTLMQGIMQGESQRKLISRIRTITGQSLYQAKRVAQTERTRVQSQARYDGMTDAANMGIVMYKQWTTRMVNSRDTHIALNGKEIRNDEVFANGLRYPGDPNGVASEVINCHCVLIPVVKRRGK